MGKRVNVKGHYRVIERDEKGRFTSSKKWSPKKHKVTESDYTDWEIDECDNCIRTAHKAMWESIDQPPEKWICVGNIPEPHDPNDIHDQMNKVRLCFNKEKFGHATVYEWTPYEASLVSLFIAMAISNELYDNQSYLNEKNEIVHNSFRSETQ